MELLPLSSAICERIQQVKFDENPEQLLRTPQSDSLSSVLIADDEAYKYFVKNPSSSSQNDYKVMKYFEETGVTPEQFFVLTIPKTGYTGTMGAAGTKLMLKKTQQPVNPEEITLA